jgi:branched-chain amino acid transport system substrate-binding protein
LRRLAVLLLVALVATGCGGRGKAQPQVPRGGALTIYTSLPRHGDSATDAQAVLAGQRLALADHHGRAAGRDVRLVPLDSSRPDGETWDPAIVERNAKRAVDDPATIAYLGELDYGGSAISVPVTNKADILQLSPFDGLTSLTREQPGGPRGGPERYYPGGERTFARLVPTDLAHATELVDLAREEGATRLAIVHDDQLYGRAIAGQAAFVAQARKLDVVATKEIRRGDDPAAYADAVRSLAEADPESRPDAVIYAGLADATAGPLLSAVERGLPDVRVLAAGIAPERPLTGVGSLLLTSAARPVRDYPPAARRVLARIAGRERGAQPPVAALYGYESMRLVLEAIDRAGPRAGDRAAVVREALRPGPRLGSVLGSLSLTPEGDVADQRVAVYRRSGAAAVYDGLRTPDVPALPAAPGDAGS